MFFFDEEPKISEKEIQILYQTHPYLIERGFLNQKIVPQYSLPSGFADIVVFLENEIVIIELKVGILENEHLLQLYGYLEDVMQKFKNIEKIRGILIGQKPVKDLYMMVDNFSFGIKILVLNTDITTKVKICNKCRLANDLKNMNCVFCHSDIFLV